MASRAVTGPVVRRGVPQTSEIVQLEDDGDRVTPEIQHALPTARIASPERGELLRLTQTVDDILDLIEDVAHELPQLTDCLPRTRRPRRRRRSGTSRAPP
jgi:uncharacterized protein Yka (UPF0111/DUF47 family)